MKKNGFTLIEVLTSVAVVAIISIVVVQSFVTIIRSNNKTEALKEVKQNGDYIVNLISRQVQNATEIDPVCDSALGNTLTVRKVNPDGTVEYDNTFSYDSGLGTVYLTDNLDATPTPVAITSNKVFAETMTFSCSDVRGKRAKVAVAVTMRQALAASLAATHETARLEFSDTVQMRNVYD